MSTFLQLVKDVRQEVGIPGDGPLTVLNQTGELKKVVDWTRKAWIEIQSERNDWAFMWMEFSATWPAGEPTQTANGVARWNLRSFAYYPLGEPSKKQALRHVSYERFEQLYERTPLTDSQYPTVITVAPDGTLRVNCVPSSTFAITGKYYRTPQILDADDELPILRYDYHDWIMWTAVKKYAANDEATLIYQDARDNARNYKQRAVRDFLPPLNTDIPGMGEA